MSVCEDMRALAYNLVRETNNNYLLGETIAYPILLMGIGIYQIESYTKAGHNYQTVIDAIHKYNEENPEDKVPIGFECGLRDIVNNVGDITTLTAAFNCICYEMKKQKENNCSFTIDCEQLLKELRDKVKDNYNEIKSNFKDIDDYYILDYLNDTKLFNNTERNLKNYEEN